jgi:hypothetical protein
VVLQQAPQVVAFNAQATAVMGFTHTYLQPSLSSHTAGCFVQCGSRLIITGMTADGQWYRLDTHTWIPSSLVQ